MEWVIVVIALVVLLFWGVKRSAETARGLPRKAAERMEALFKATFPDLQPYFHPRNLVDYVRARRAMRPSQAGKTWKNPPGFGVDQAEIRFDSGTERVRLLDAAGALLAQFVFEEHTEGGVLRVGKGKFTVNVLDAQRPAVRYWHPDREFKWKNGQWTFQTRVADRAIDSDDRGTSYSSDSGSSSSTSSSIAQGAAIGAGIAAAGGTFDGGGASAAWDGASTRTSY